MNKQNLNNLIYYLDTLKEPEIADLKQYFHNFSINCNGCSRCSFTYAVLQVYELHNQKHICNRRKDQFSLFAEDFIHILYPYFKNGKK